MHSMSVLPLNILAVSECAYLVINQNNFITQCCFIVIYFHVPGLQNLAPPLLLRMFFFATLKWR